MMPAEVLGGRDAFSILLIFLCFSALILLVACTLTVVFSCVALARSSCSSQVRRCSAAFLLVRRR